VFVVRERGQVGVVGNIVEAHIGHCLKEEVIGLTLEEEWDLLPSLLLQQTDDK